MPTDRKATSQVPWVLWILQPKQANNEIISAAEQTYGTVQVLVTTHSKAAFQEGALEMVAAVVLELFSFWQSSKKVFMLLALSNPYSCSLKWHWHLQWCWWRQCRALRAFPWWWGYLCWWPARPRWWCLSTKTPELRGTTGRGLASNFIAVTYTLALETHDPTQSDIRWEVWADQAGTQDRRQEHLDLGVELDQLGDKDLKQVGRRPLALEAVEVWSLAWSKWFVF